jgi:hypothetical protein
MDGDSHDVSPMASMRYGEAMIVGLLLGGDGGTYLTGSQ